MCPFPFSGLLVASLGGPGPVVSPSSVSGKRESLILAQGHSVLAEAREKVFPASGVRRHLLGQDPMLGLLQQAIQRNVTLLAGQPQPPCNQGEYMRVPFLIVVGGA